MHRDLKPANILVTREHQTLKLADFSLTTRFHRSNHLSVPVRREHTCNIGTTRYTAPEVLERLYDGDAATACAAYTEKADIYSAALVIYYFLTGWQPACDVRRNPRARPAARRCPHMAALLERMWGHDADARQTVAECAAAVRLMPPSAGLCALAAAGCALQ
jgi:serine/threonine protein kinase